MSVCVCVCQVESTLEAGLTSLGDKDSSRVAQMEAKRKEREVKECVCVCLGVCVRHASCYMCPEYDQQRRVCGRGSALSMQEAWYSLIIFRQTPQ